MKIHKKKDLNKRHFIRSIKKKHRFATGTPQPDPYPELFKPLPEIVLELPDTEDILRQCAQVANFHQIKEKNLD